MSLQNYGCVLDWKVMPVLYLNLMQRSSSVIHAQGFILPREEESEDRHDSAEDDNTTPNIDSNRKIKLL